MKILVTGAVGFIGSHTAERLKIMGYDVVGVDNFSPYYSPLLKKQNEAALRQLGIPVLNIDLRADNISALLPNDVAFIFHFAAQPGISETSTFQDYLSNNVLATKNLIDYALQLPNLELFVNIATSSIYGLEATFPESVAPQPASFYGVTKLAAEQLVLQKSREQQLKACSLRLYSVYGPRERPEKMYTKLIACGFKNKAFPLYTGSANHLRSFTYVSDIVDGVVAVLQAVDAVNGAVINLGTEQEHTTQEGIDAVRQVMQTDIPIQLVAARAGDQLRTKAHIEKARKLLQYNPQTTLLEGIEKQVMWYKTHVLPTLG
ncbi:NAD-dependent epimerase/dehydratase family protein [Bizionia sediminis]|uniref:NAD-dependent epimerase/dehydratase family protein n=1 Tax=Bizionia sediminis TaxID=1737064 RepID=A0ABW5KN17_9FLAO